MKICLSCGRSYDDGGDFCRHCGQPLTTLPQPEPPPAHNSTKDLVGMVLDGKYRLDAAIGSGGMGCVFRAMHLHIGRTVALKLLHKEMTSDGQAVERFRREARAAASIQHPNAVSVLDFGTTNEGQVYIVMEYLEGCDLRAKLIEKRVLDPKEAIGFILPVLSALGRAHKKGVIHRDLKPDNVWLTVDEESGEPVIKVLDFGIAKLKDQGGAKTLTEHGMLVGTPQYMSPEQVRGDKIDARSDIYSLGIMLYEMLGGRRPFDGQNPFIVATKHIHEMPVPLQQVNPNVPKLLADVVMATLSKDREQRPPTAAAFARALIDAHDRTAALGDRLPSEALPLDLSSSQSFDSPFKAAPEPLPRTIPFSGTVPPDPATTSRRLALPITIGLVIVTLVGGMAAYVAYRPPPVSNTNNTNANNTNVRGTEIVVPPDMVLIPAGHFTMGTDDPDISFQGNTNRDANLRVRNSPAHDEYVESFLMDKYEVTNAQYAEFVNAMGRKGPWPGGKMPPGSEDLPVTEVSWEDAQAYAEWKEKRLPTEKEWEYAARGPESLKYPWGNEWDPTMGNFRERRLMPVGSYEKGASPFGVHDMANNAAEWVEDAMAPYSGSNFRPDIGQFRVFRGGHVAVPPEPEIMALWSRQYQSPTIKRSYLGFRCAKSLK